MSHLPLDARAILHHLNELGYRNISAEQLREFLKGKTTLTQTTKRIQKKIPNQRQQFPPLHFVCMCVCVCVLACVCVLSACNKHFEELFDFSTILFLFSLKLYERFVTLPHCTRKANDDSSWQCKKKKKNEIKTSITREL